LYTRGKNATLKRSWLMRDGIVLTMDEEQIVQEADHIGRAAWQRLFEARPDLKE
jgi:hypothetical protein